MNAKSIVTQTCINVLVDKKTVNDTIIVKNSIKKLKIMFWYRFFDW